MVLAEAGEPVHRRSAVGAMHPGAVDRQVNSAASGALLSASRARAEPAVLTPLSTGVLVMVMDISFHLLGL